MCGSNILERAAELWYSAKISRVHLNSWEDFSRDLMDRFRPTGFANACELKLKKLQQQRGEGVRSFEERFRETHSQAGLLAHIDHYIRFWVKGLQTGWPLEVALQEPQTF